MARLHIIACLSLLLVGHIVSAELQVDEATGCEKGRCVTPTNKLSLRGLAQRSLLAVPKAPVCPAGEYLQLLEGKCKKCTPGRAKKNKGAGTCAPCRKGSYAEAEGSAACTPCPAGTTSVLPLPTRCNACPAGTYAPEAGSVRCIPCFENSISEAGASECERCPRGTSTRGKSGQWQCVPDN
uniref:Tyrosine-protein kinase ephrin type A/B receptor-like domain-containing protein n=1 Tax=Chlamydomonas leiostraca TaxID=1034604 RepID=A0A7S0S1H0_9CHLO|mmetsp:Transcript_37473/g.94581  ORF Transcript_37473/g.94581 Transcript_37473/m.94581 type:complete len:182 (+) Transcript_37473:176-721(+)|eukprot:CAMPEP_0202868372 /NCGR_PEP_ID=MMETSP1391-20130828/10844_1 /ASSEMBLY_ACC=CAM_ASM_000867 /TAXON_ID=1034604 /ORGANISM="Chlamydomonas leiostraca, Strain SAG 11-49" /LENGTH=181 /DNA_ID=CAMNT_0049548537 /DNA_START=183 /DNA_END=728 /DNA_ORIENTATION=-